MQDWQALRRSLLSDKTDSILPPTVELPILPKALMEFRKMSEDPDAETEEMSKIIASDAGLSTELLRNVNTCSSGTRNRITSVKQALVTLGIRATLLHLTTCGVKEMMKSTSSKLVNFQNFWNTNLERALFARELASLLGADKDLAFTAGMLQDFLLPLIGNQLIDHYLEFSDNREQYGSLDQFERQTMGWDHAEAAAHVMRAWQFPDELVCCVYLHHKGTKILQDENFRDTSVAAVAISSLMPDALRQSLNGLEQLMELEKEWDELQLQTMVETIHDEFQEMTNVKNHFSFLRVYQNAIKRAATPQS